MGRFMGKFVVEYNCPTHTTAYLHVSQIGDESLESLRASVDLASSYALQGMWPQVTEHMAIASQKLITVASQKKRDEHAIRCGS
jgi:hypothetical protein